MTHLITFISSFLAITTYASLVFRFWLKRLDGDKEEAGFLTFATFVGTAIVMVLTYVLWMLTK
jgi:hypothetical protein